MKPFLTRPPEDVVALVGETVEFTCGVGGDPLPDILWRRHAPGGTMPLGRVRVLEDRSLRLERIVLADQGRYTCEADNPAGALTASATLTVNAAPAFMTKPLAQTAEAGREVVFHCKVQVGHLVIFFPSPSPSPSPCPSSSPLHSNSLSLST